MAVLHLEHHNGFKASLFIFPSRIKVQSFYDKGVGQVFQDSY